MDINDLRAHRAAVAAEMKKLVTGGDENKVWTDKEADRFSALERDAALLERQIKACERAEAMNQDLARVPEQVVRSMPANSQRPDPESGISCIGELCYLARYEQHDPRIRALQMETGSSGGFAVPAQFETTVRQLNQQIAIFRPRAVTIEAGDPPDAEYTIPALDQGTDDRNMFGGVTMAWKAEGKAPDASDVYLREVTLKPNEVSGYVVVTNKLLNNWRAANPLIERLLSGAAVAAEDQAFYNGDGVGKPHGACHASAAGHIDVARDTASQVKFVDVVTMLSKSRRGATGLFWLASDALLPQLCQMVDAGSNLVWQPSARDGEPDRLMGKPIVWSERAVDLGTRADLSLLDLAYYLIKNGSPMRIQANPYLYMKEGKTEIILTWCVDGQSWLSDSIKTESGRKRSPFVILK